MSLIRLLNRNVGVSPDAVMLRFEGRSTTYKEFYSLSLQAAQLLQTHGVGRGDRVALMCYNTPGFLIAMFGAWHLGASVVPVNHKLQAPELAYILDHSSAKLIVYDAVLDEIVNRTESTIARLSTAGQVPNVMCFDTELAHQSVWQGPEPDSDQEAEILYTSGTTGKPKGCIHTHRSVMNAALATAAGISLTRLERMLMVMPIWHASPLNNWTMGTIQMGGTLVLLREYHPVEFLAIIQQEKITATFCAPIALLAPLAAVPNFADYDLSSVTKWVYGGGPIGEEQAKRLIHAYQSEHFYQVYGMTETGPLGTTLFAEDALPKAGSIGKLTTPTVEMRVITEAGHPAQAGEVGEIHLRSGAVMQGYLNNPTATREAITEDGWYLTGDLARVDEDGYLFIVDRNKDVIITGGENVYSKEVEDVLGGHESVLDVAVIGRKHPEWGETVVACVILRNASEASDALVKDLQDYCSSRLARYKIPRHIEFMTELPRTPSGKLMKHVIRANLA